MRRTFLASMLWGFRSQAGPRKRAAVRMSQSRPIFRRLHRALVLFKTSRRYLPRSAFGQAIDYAERRIARLVDRPIGFVAVMITIVAFALRILSMLLRRRCRKSSNTLGAIAFTDTL